MPHCLAPLPSNCIRGPLDLEALWQDIEHWAKALGFARIGVADIDLSAHEPHLLGWLEAGYHGTMDYMARHGLRRARPAELLPGTVRVLCARMAYHPPQARPAAEVLADPQRAYLSRYALGRDYHKVMRTRLQHLARQIETASGPFGYRVFCDSAPVLEKALAQQAGLGWIGKHSNLLAADAGSWFFLGEIYTDLPFPCSRPVAAQCGACAACMHACPTQAIIAPYIVDARRCISYLTIEHPGSIPIRLRPLLGNRIYGCDSCQLACPWNRLASPTPLADFYIRHALDNPALLELFAWDEATFLARTEGSVIRRIGYLRWQRNLAVALGNAPPSPAIHRALQIRYPHADELVREHIRWALDRHLRACLT